MRWLLLDAGNTALKWAVVLAEEARWPLEGDAEDGQSVRGAVALDSPELGAEIARACAVYSAATGAPAPAAVVGCTVAASDKVELIEGAVRAANAPAVRWLGAGERFDHDGIQVQNGYAKPEQLGADRWHALIGARARAARGALAVVSFGTATTIDTLDAEGRFRGGVIAPGLELMLGSLARGTGRLPLARGNYVDHPDNTDDAVRTGVTDAQIGLVERRLRRIRELLGRTPQVLVCGGNAPALLPLFQAHGGLGKVTHEPDLVLLGVWHHARARVVRAITGAA